MTLEERCKKFATRNYVNSDGEVVATIVDGEVYNNALLVAKTVKRETIDKACEALFTIIGCHPDKRKYFEDKFRKAMEE